MHNEERQNWRLKGSEDRLMLVATDATQNHVWVHYPAATGVCYHQRPGKHPWSRLPYSGILLAVRAVQKGEQTLEMREQES